MSGALLGGLTAAALPVLQTHLPTSLADLTGLAAGIGIVLLARSPDGILGMSWLTNRIHLPFGDEDLTVGLLARGTRRWPMPPDVAGTDLGTSLEVDHVSVHFGGVAALSDVSLRAEAGAVTGLIGPNGAGKTTLFNVITGLQRPNRGSVSLGGTDVTRKGTHRRARLGLARTFQRLELFSTLSAVDNVRVGLEASGRAAPAAAIGLLDRVGVGEEASAPVSSLPTGSARLVELARALSTDPKVLLLDEPCSGLDERESVALGELSRRLPRKGAPSSWSNTTRIWCCGSAAPCTCSTSAGSSPRVPPKRSAATRPCRRRIWVTPGTPE